MKKVNGILERVRKFRMVIQPLILSLPVIILWHFMYVFGWHSTSLKTDEPVVNAILPIIATFHAFLVSFNIYREENSNSRVKALAKKGADDFEAEKEFLELVEDRISTPLKYVLLSTGFIIQIWTTTLYCESYWTGMFSVLSISYVIILIWEVMIDLDDPVHGIWIIKEIPKKWADKARIEKRFVDTFFDKIFGELGWGHW